MGMFIKFGEEDDWYPARDKSNDKPIEPVERFVTDDGLGVGDLICSGLTDDFRPLNEFIIASVTEDKRIFGRLLKNSRDGEIEEWNYPTRIKIANALLGEYGPH